MFNTKCTNKGGDNISHDFHLENFIVRLVSLAMKQFFSLSTFFFFARIQNIYVEALICFANTFVSLLT
jgi:hypothetical protein